MNHLDRDQTFVDVNADPGPAVLFGGALPASSEPRRRRRLA